MRKLNFWLIVCVSLVLPRRSRPRIFRFDCTDYGQPACNCPAGVHRHGHKRSRKQWVTWSVLPGAARFAPAPDAARHSHQHGQWLVNYLRGTTAPSGGTIIVIATSVTDPTKSASATVTVTAGVNNASLSGDYAFSFSGTSASGSFTFAAWVDSRRRSRERDERRSRHQRKSVAGPNVTQRRSPGLTHRADNRGVMTWDILARYHQPKTAICQDTFA